ncbi:hypothetical protein D3C85_1486420 [compost metagenome]
MRLSLGFCHRNGFCDQSIATIRPLLELCEDTNANDIHEPSLQVGQVLIVPFQLRHGNQVGRDFLDSTHDGVDAALTLDGLIDLSLLAGKVNAEVLTTTVDADTCLQAVARRDQVAFHVLGVARLYPARNRVPEAIWRDHPAKLAITFRVE